MSTISIYKLIEHVEEAEFYDIAHFRVGFMNDEGVLLKLPVPKTLNTDQLDNLLTGELVKLIHYLRENKAWQETPDND
jgi:hypothetical protein